MGDDRLDGSYSLVISWAPVHPNASTCFALAIIMTATISVDIQYFLSRHLGVDPYNSIREH